MKQYFNLTVVILILCSGLCSAKMPSAGAILPEDTLFSVEIDNFAETGEVFKKTDGYKLLSAPSMKPFMDKLRKGINQLIEENKELGIIDANDANSLPQGRVVFAGILRAGNKENQDGAVWAMEFGKNLANAKKKIDKLTKKAIDAGAVRTKRKVKGLEVTTLIKKKDGPSPSSNSSTQTVINYCFIDDIFIGSVDTKPEITDFIISQVKGGSADTLKKNEDYIRLMQATKIKDSVKVFLNIKRIIKQIVSKDASGAVAGQMDIAGVSNISALAVQFGVDAKTYNVKWRALLKINGAKKGFIKMLEPKNADVVIPEYVDVSTDQVSVINWDIRKAYQQFAATLTAMNPQMAMFLNMPIPTPDGSRAMTLQQDIIANLGDQIAFSTVYDVQDEHVSQVVLFSIKVDNSEKLEETVSALHSLYIASAKPELKREFLGHNIYLIDLASTPFGGGMSNMADNNNPPAQVQDAPKLAITITDSYLIISLEKEVEKAIRLLKNPRAEKLENAKWFRTVRSKIPASVGIAGFENVRNIYKQLWNLIKKQGLTAFNSSIKAAETAKISKYVDFSLLPDYKLVEKYFGLAGSFLLSRDDGFYCEGFTVNIPK